MSSFSLDEAASAFAADMGTLLGRLRQAAAPVASASLAVRDDNGTEHFALLEDVGHSVRGTSRLVGASSLAECGVMLEEIAAEGRAAMADAERALERARAIALRCIEGAQDMARMVELELHHEPDAAMALARKWLQGPSVSAFRLDDRSSEAAPVAPDDSAEGFAFVDTGEVSRLDARRAVLPGPMAEEAPAETAPPAEISFGQDAFAADEVDDDLREVFRAEATELADPIQEAFGRIADPSAGASGDLGRLFHTLKGAAATVGLGRIAELCLELEGRFESIAAAKTALTAELIADSREKARAVYALAGVRLGLGTEQFARPPVEAFDLEAASQAATGGLTGELVDAFRDEVRQLANSIRTAIVHVAARPHDVDTLVHLERSFHTLKGAAATVGLVEIADLATRVQEIAEAAADANVAASPDLVDEVVKLTNEIFDKSGLPPVRLSTEAADSLRPELQREAREILTAASALLPRLRGSDDLGRARARHELSELLHRLAGAASVNEARAVSEDALRLERLCLDESADVAEITRGLQRIASLLELSVSGLLQSPTSSYAAGVPAVGAAQAAPTADAPVRVPVKLVAHEEVFEAFRQECADLLEALDKSILAAQESANPRDDLVEISRLVHTLKGSVSTVGLAPTGRLLHRAEDALTSLASRSVLPPMRAIASILLTMQDEVRRHLRQAPRGYVETAYAAFDRDVENLIGTGRRTFAAAAPATSKAVDSDDEGHVPRDAEARTIRVASERIDALMTLAGELVLSRARLLARVSSLRGLQSDLDGSRSRLLGAVDGFVERYEFSTIGGARQLVVDDRHGRPTLTMEEAAPTTSVTGAIAAFSDLELDRYEDVNILARSLAEISNDMTELHGQLFGELSGFVEDSDSFSSLVSNMQREVTRARLVPLDSLFTRIRLLILDSAEREGKDVGTEIVGHQVTLDKAILDALYTPILHLVRNAVVHGIEEPQARLRAGKPAKGKVTISARQEAGRVVVDVTDDGSGLNLVALKERGVALGLVSPDTPLESAAIMNLVFAPGLSTRTTASSTAGRGVGGDVVRSAIEALNGEVYVNTSAGRGTTFHIVLPLTLAITRALIVRIGKHGYAIPLYLTEHIFEAGEANIIESAGVRRLMVEGRSMRAVRLADLLGVPAKNPNGPYVIVGVGDARLAVQVDAVTSQDEIFVRSLGTLLTGHQLFAGVTVSGTGEAQLIFDVQGLLDAAGVSRSGDVQAVLVQPGETASHTAEAPEAPGRRRVLFIDDSLSVRKVADKFLSALGVDVTVAVDGVDGLEKLRTQSFDLVFTDLEMPRLHGYDLIREIRFNPAYRDLPVVVVTSRSSQKHRDHARAVGANDYVTKPFTQERFAEILTRWLPAQGTRAEVHAP